MTEEFATTSNTPPPTALDIIRNRKVTHADGKAVDQPFSLKEVADDGAIQEAKRVLIEKQATDAESVEPQEEVIPAETQSGEGEGDGEHLIPKSRFDQVNNRMKAAETGIVERDEANAELRTDLATMKREKALDALDQGQGLPDGYDDMKPREQATCMGRLMNQIDQKFETDSSSVRADGVAKLAKDEGFTREQAEMVTSIGEDKDLSHAEALAVARLRTPEMFSDGSSQDLSAVPTSHAAQPPQGTKTRQAPTQTAKDAAKALPQSTGGEQTNKAMATLRALRRRAR